ncbi:MAG: hypothetical protein AB7O59_19740 [Pirellulales bacterium]
MVVYLLQQQQAAAFEPYSYNELRKIDRDQVTSEFHSKWVNYVDDQDRWQPIDLSFEEDSEGFHLTRAPYELQVGKLSTDPMRFVATNRYSVSDRQIRDDAPLGKTRRFTRVAPVAGQVTDNGILYANALQSIGADLLLQPHEMEARYLVVWNTPPACEESVAISFEETYDEGQPTMHDGQPVPADHVVLDGGFSVGRNDFRGLAVPQGKIWDSQGKVAPVTIEGSFSDGVFRGQKVIPCSFFKDASYPVYTDDTNTFYPDPNPETNTVDGTVVYTDATGFSQTGWDNVHDATSGTSANDTAATNDFARTGKTSAGFTGNRGFLLFNTASLGNVQINSATISVYATGKNNGDNDGDDFIVFVAATPASNTALVTGDWDQCGAVDSPTEVSSRVDIGSITTGAYNDFSVTNVGTISTSGITKLCGREGHDVLDTLYTGSNDTYNDIAISFAEETGTSQDPKLVVTYTAGTDLEIDINGDATVESGGILLYTLTATNNGPLTANGLFVSDTIPAGFSFRNSESSGDCSVVGSAVKCGNFNLASSTSTGRTIAFNVATGTCDVQRTNTATISGATVVDAIIGNNSGSVVTTVTCPSPFITVRKSADENVASSTTLQNDDHLKITLQAGKTYAFNGAIFATSTSSAPDIKIAFTTPSGTTMDIGFLAAFGTQIRRAEMLETSGVASSPIAIGSNTNTVIQLMGTIAVGGTGGDITLQWAQGTSNGTATTVKQGSFLSVVEME